MVNLPGLLFVAAFSVSCPVILWVPLYQFLFVGYWFWGRPGPDQLWRDLGEVTQRIKPDFDPTTAEARAAYAGATA